MKQREKASARGRGGLSGVLKALHQLEGVGKGCVVKYLLCPLVALVQRQQHDVKENDKFYYTFAVLSGCSKGHNIVKDVDSKNRLNTVYCVPTITYYQKLGI